MTPSQSTESTQSTIVFRDPPPIRRPRKQKAQSEAGQFLHDIAHRPGEWAVYRTGVNKGTSYSLVNKLRKAHPNSEWVARPGRGKTYTIYARVLRAVG